MALVRFKPTGQLGELPDEEFDPNLYEPVTQPKGNFFSDLIGYAARPFTNTAKKIGATIETGGLYAASPEFRKQLRGEKLTAREAKRLAYYRPEFEQTAKVQTVGDQTVGTLKDLAGLASYAVPFGKGAGIVSKALLPGAAASGLLETAQPNATIGSVGRSAATGAATAGALYGIGKLVSAAKGGLKRTGEATIQSQYNVPRSIARSNDIRDTVQKLSDYGINNINDIEPAANAVTGSKGILSQVTREAAGQAKNVKTEGLLDIARNLADDPSIPTGQDDKIFDFLKKGVNSLYETSGKGPATAASPLNTLDYIRTLESKAAGIIRGRSPSLVPEADKAAAAAYRSFADELSTRLFQGAGADKVAVNLAKNPQVLSQLAAVSPKLAENAAKATTVAELRSLAAPFVRGAKLAAETEVGQNLATNTVAGAAKGVGRLIQNPLNILAIPLSSNSVNAGAGAAMRGLGNIIPAVNASPAVVNVGSRLGGALAGSGMQEESVLGAQSSLNNQMQGGNQGADYIKDSQTGNYTSSDGQWVWDGQQWQPNQQNAQGQGFGQEYFQQLALQDLQTTGGKNLSKIKQAMEIISPQAKGQVVNPIAQTGLDNLGEIERAMKTTSRFGNIADQFSPLAKNEFNSSVYAAARNYLNLTSKYPPTEEKIKETVKNIFPSPYVSDKENKRRMDNVRRTFERFYYTKPTDDLLGQILSQGGAYGQQ